MEESLEEFKYLVVNPHLALDVEACRSWGEVQVELAKQKAEHENRGLIINDTRIYEQINNESCM